MIHGGVFFKRHTLQEGNRPPADFEPATEFDPVTGKQQGWVPVSPDGPEDQYFREALHAAPQPLPDGTYERIQRGAERPFSAQAELLAVYAAGPGFSTLLPTETATAPENDS